MIASVHIADISRRAALRVLRKAPTAATVPGLRFANNALAAPLSGSLLAAPQFGRAGLVAFWDDEASLDHFLAEHPTARALADGWRVRLEPLRIHGSWPGVPDDLPRSRTVDHVGPAAVLTLGRLKFNRALAFLRTSAKAEGAVVNAPGMRWATGLAKPPFVCTCSLWESDDAVRAYAYSDAPPEHSNAIATDRAKGFHKQSAFIRFRPYGSEGKLDGKNPLPESWMST
ncbi:MAG: spheroidene monooxygenase [Acidimicrobiia bacterium]|nr:spheroidene monooxygenase [Acidimicrobiia bacterium]